MLLRANQVAERITAGERLVLAGEEALLRQLPRGAWIGGTIPYFMAPEGGRVSREHVFVETVPDAAADVSIRVYDRATLPRIAAEAPDRGYTVAIVPAFSTCHEAYAVEAPTYDEMFLKVVAGWVSGVHLDDLGAKMPLVFDGRTGEAHRDRVVAMRVALQETHDARLEIVNIFEPGTGPGIRFPRAGFTATECTIEGTPANFAAYVAQTGLDTRLPLVADYLGTRVNVSIQTLADGETRFYAPVFDGVTYRFAKPVPHYAQRFDAAIPARAARPALAYNCVLNFLYGNLEGRRTGPILGPMTFGEIGYQLLNQTLVAVRVEPVLVTA